MIKIGSIGYNHIHENGFFADRPHGAGAWLFLLVKTPSEFEINSVKHSLKAGSAVVLSPNTPLRYGSESTYIDDWFYFGMTNEDKKALEESGIYADVPIYLGAIDGLSSLIYEMTVEFYSVEEHHDEIVSLYTEILLRRISRLALKSAQNRSGASEERRTSLAHLRSRIYRDPASLPAVSELAEELEISVSGLEHLYKKSFGVSVMSDVISSRVHCAKNLLLSTNMLISEIAEKCGYNCCYSFMRQFKAKTGMTPSEFRKREAVGVGNQNI